MKGLNYDQNLRQQGKHSRRSWLHNISMNLDQSLNVVEITEKEIDNI